MAQVVGLRKQQAAIAESLQINSTRMTFRPLISGLSARKWRCTPSSPTGWINFASNTTRSWPPPRRENSGAPCRRCPGWLTKAPVPCAGN